LTYISILPAEVPVGNLVCTITYGSQHREIYQENCYRNFPVDVFLHLPAEVPQGKLNVASSLMAHGIEIYQENGYMEFPRQMYSIPL
jgi:hypothetical protein